MDDEQDDDVGVFDFDELANDLLEQGQEASPALLHGCLTGQLAAGAQPQGEWGLDALTQALGLEFHGELAGRLMQLYSVTAAALIDDEFRFSPLLPDDDEEVAIRAEALGQWCQGFLLGYAYSCAALGLTEETRSADSDEILGDIAVMAQAAVDEEEDDESEENFTEIVEYLRIAILNVFAENSNLAGDSFPISPQTLH